MTRATNGAKAVLAALGFWGAAALSSSAAQAANIITFDNNPTSCGGSTLCSTNGTPGYTGTNPFDLSTLTSWFQIDTESPPVNHLPGTQTGPEPNGGAGQFLVVNDTGATVTNFSLTLTDTFTSSTPSVTFCSGSSGPRCDNFQAGKGAAAPSGAGEALSGPDFVSCTNGSAGSGFPCFSTGGQAAANFMPNGVTYNWTGLNIASGHTFDITFASWNNSAYTTSVVPESSTWAMLLLGFAGLGFAGFRLSRNTDAEVSA
jgi:hypothetical protein